MYQPSEVPAPVADALAMVRACGDPGLREQLLAGGAEHRAAWLAGLQQLADAVAAATALAIDVFDSQGDALTLHGASSTQSWLRGALRLTPGEASTRVHVARASRGPLVTALQKLLEGTLTDGHVRTIDRQVRRLPEHHQSEAATVLTELAEVASVSAVRAAGEHLTLLVDPDGTLAECERQFDRRYLTLSPMLDGMTALDGLLDAESAALLHTVLEPFLTPTGAHDQRSAAQRRADGLMQVVQSAADVAALPASGGERTHLHVVVNPVGGPSVAHLVAAVAVLPDAPGGPTTLHPISAARLFCDAALTPLWLDEHGVVTAMGRSQRLFTRAQRAFLAARDGGCRWPGCTRPSAHTDAHHLVSWLDGGATDVDNGLLLCRFHHRLLHEGGWSMTAVDTARGANGPVTLTGPHLQQLTGHPRGP